MCFRMNIPAINIFKIIQVHILNRIRAVNNFFSLASARAKMFLARGANKKTKWAATLADRSLAINNNQFGYFVIDTIFQKLHAKWRSILSGVVLHVYHISFI